MTHAPEPWRSRRVGTIVLNVVDAEGSLLFSFYAKEGSQRAAGITRLVGAVNACAGLPTADLEEGLLAALQLKLSSFAAEVAALKEQVARLHEQVALAYHPPGSPGGVRQD